MVAAAVSLVVRLVRSRGEERQQIKWFVFAAALVPLWFLVNAPIEQASPILFRVLDALYFGAIVLSQQVFVFLTSQRSTLAVVASTLVIAALFNLLRHRTQSFVDRRF
jgi:phosphatidylserine synthase